MTQGSILNSSGSPMSFEDYWKSHSTLGSGENPDSLGNKFFNLFTGDVSAARDWYNQKYNEWSAGQKAQADYEMSRVLRSTQYQDLVKDLRAAGINPYAVLANGGMSAGNLSYSSAEAPMKNSSSKSSGSAKAFTALAIIIGAIIKAVL